MVKITCRAIDCIYWEDGHCSADKIIYDPEEGCLTYELLDDVLDEDDWEDVELVDELGDDIEDPFEEIDDPLLGAVDDLDEEW